MTLRWPLHYPTPLRVLLWKTSAVGISDVRRAGSTVFVSFLQMSSALVAFHPPLFVANLFSVLQFYFLQCVHAGSEPINLRARSRHVLYRCRQRENEDYCPRQSSSDCYLFLRVNSKVATTYSGVSRYHTQENVLLPYLSPSLFPPFAPLVDIYSEVTLRNAARPPTCSHVEIDQYGYQSACEREDQPRTNMH